MDPLVQLLSKHEAVANHSVTVPTTNKAALLTGGKISLVLLTRSCTNALILVDSFMSLV